MTAVVTELLLGGALQNSCGYSDGYTSIATACVKTHKRLETKCQRTRDIKRDSCLTFHVFFIIFWNVCSLFCFWVFFPTACVIRNTSLLCCTIDTCVLSWPWLVCPPNVMKTWGCYIWQLLVDCWWLPPQEGTSFQITIETVRTAGLLWLNFDWSVCVCVCDLN